MPDLCGYSPILGKVNVDSTLYLSLPHAGPVMTKGRRIPIPRIAAGIAVDSIVLAASHTDILQAVGIVQGLLSGVQAVQAALEAAGGSSLADDGVVALAAQSVRVGSPTPSAAPLSGSGTATASAGAPGAPSTGEPWATAVVSPTRMRDLSVAVRGWIPWCT
jgi:hypothetical protein